MSFESPPVRTRETDVDQFLLLQETLESSGHIEAEIVPFQAEFGRRRVRGRLGGAGNAPGRHLGQERSTQDREAEDFLVPEEGVFSSIFLSSFFLLRQLLLLC